MEDVQLVFIPGPGMGHLVAAVEAGKLLVGRDKRISITYLIIKLPIDTGIDDAYTQSLFADATHSQRFRFLDVLPQAEDPDLVSKPPNLVTYELFNSSKPHVRDAVANLITCRSSRVAAVLVDMFCVNMIEVASEFGLPSYVFFTSSVGFLGLMLQVQILRDEHQEDVTQYKDTPDLELLVPAFSKPVPARVLPSAMMDDKNGGYSIVLSTARRIREAKAIVVNSFLDLEPYAVNALSSDRKTPPIYPIGPVINLNHYKRDEEIMSWLDNQPDSSVVFLCFGSLGSFNSREQVREMAVGLERSGYRFLWSLRRPRPPSMAGDAPGDQYENRPEEQELLLPDGFLERIGDFGKVIGWAPQVGVLSHPAIGGFVSHCGWNSILESLWFGVPIATWPMYAEQQINAFEMVTELGLGVDIRMDYRNDEEVVVIVSADEIEGGIRRLMTDDVIRKRVNDIKDKSRRATEPAGSSYITLGCLIDNILEENPQY